MKLKKKKKNGGEGEPAKASASTTGRGSRRSGASRSYRGTGLLLHVPQHPIEKKTKVNGLVSDYAWTAMEQQEKGRVEARNSTIACWRKGAR
jgi:hypothetical protein